MAGSSKTPAAAAAAGKASVKPSTSSSGSGSSSSSGGPSLVNVILLYVMLIGLGAMGGFLSFHFMFVTRCEDLLDTTERNHNETSAELVHRYLQAVDMHRQCLEDKKQKLELLELRGQLDGQDSLVGRHRQLLDKHQESVERLSDLQGIHEDTLRKFHSLQEDIDTKKKELADVETTIQEYTETKNQMEKKMIDQRDLSTTIVKKKMEENKRLRTEMESCLASQRMAEYDITEMKQHVQLRQLAATKERHGKGPFYIQFFLKFSGYNTESFVVELPSVRELPHSVYTLLDLVEAKLYDGTTFLVNENGIMRIGGNPTGTNSATTRLAQRYKNHGYDESALFFVETSNTNYCRRHSVGFVGRGPGLALYLSDYDKDHNNREQSETCLGRVVRGMKTLNRVEAAMNKGQVVDIVEVKHLVLEEESDESKKEL